MVSLFVCPHCGSPLTKEEKTYRCPNGHSFDIAKEGYVHLLPANQKHSKDPGDDKAMAAARSRFLDTGAYVPLREELCKLAAAYTETNAAVLDAGCGEGYYTAGIIEALKAAGKKVRVAGIDLSKPSLKKAARRAPEGEFSVASVYHLPVADESVDLIVNCFSPLALEEFRRVLRPGGYFLYVVPAADHLWEMKEVLYDAPYPNEEKETPYEGFAYEAIVGVEDTITLESQADIQALFGMTPYAWKTPKAGKERLAALDSLKCRIAFRIHIFKKL